MTNPARRPLLATLFSLLDVIPVDNLKTKRKARYRKIIENADISRQHTNIALLKTITPTLKTTSSRHSISVPYQTRCISKLYQYHPIEIYLGRSSLEE
jgi:hypothetical protein